MLDNHPISGNIRERNWLLRKLSQARRWLEDKLPKPVGNFFYWLRTHTYNKYHLVDCRYPRNGYSWGWIDRSELILFANMAILKDYVEKESHQIAWDSEDWPIGQVIYKEMMEILHWWEHDRKLEHDAYDELLTKAYGFEDCTVFEPCEDNPHLHRMVFTRRGDPEWEEDCRKCHEAEEALDKKDEEMLIRLIKIRGYLWS